MRARSKVLVQLIHSQTDKIFSSTRSIATIENLDYDPFTSKKIAAFFVFLRSLLRLTNFHFQNVLATKRVFTSKNLWNSKMMSFKSRILKVSLFLLSEGEN